MTIWVRLAVRPEEGAPLLDTRQRKIGKVLGSRKSSENAWEVQLEIENEEVVRQFEQQFPKYEVKEIK